MHGPTPWDPTCVALGEALCQICLSSQLQADVAGQLGIVSNNQGAALKGCRAEGLGSDAGLPEEAIWTEEMCLQPWQENLVLFELCLKPQSG